MDYNIICDLYLVNDEVSEDEQLCQLNRSTVNTGLTQLLWGSTANWSRVQPTSLLLQNLSNTQMTYFCDD